jgi:uncharacterized protein YqhQ
MWSADLAMEGEEDQPKPTPLQLILTFAGAMAIGIGIFVLIPTWLTHWLSATLFPGVKLASHAGATLWEQLTPTREALVPNTIEGLVRVVFLVLYILAIGTGKEIRRVFAYHGAEHKVVNAWEATGELTLETARGFSRIHPRCGTSFLFLTFVVGILIHALIGWPEHHGIRMLSRLILLPFVAGTAYELIRLAGRFRESNLLKVLVWPGMLLQRLTTAEPTDDQIEVALTAMRNVLEEEGELPADDSGAAPLTSVIVV